MNKYHVTSHKEIKNILINLFADKGPLYYTDIMKFLTFEPDINQKGVYACLLNSPYFKKKTNKKFYLVYLPQKEISIYDTSEKIRGLNDRSHPIFSCNRTTDFDNYISLEKYIKRAGDLSDDR
jgi:hypothetical protein